MGCILGKLAGSEDPISLPAADSAIVAGEKLAGENPLKAPVVEQGLRRNQIVGFEKDSFGWPIWLSVAAGDAMQGWAPRGADSFQKLEKIGAGTYSNVYKAIDMAAGRIVALKKVHVDGIADADGAHFLAREISLLRRLGNHPNIVRLEGLVTSRVTTVPALYLVFEYMDHDLAGLAAATDVNFTLPQVKCYMKQLLLGLEHCHRNGVLHRDIKSANLLLSNEGELKIADFGLATSYDPDDRKPMTSRVVTLWYRPPELLLGATHYGVGVDLWSVGCILAELLAGEPIFPGRTEVEQLHRIFKLCGTPSADYWSKMKLPNGTFKHYDRCLSENYKHLPPQALALLEKLLALDPDERGTAADALNSEFFNSEPYACEPSSLPRYPPSKEMDMKLKRRAAEYERKSKAHGSAGYNTAKKLRVHRTGHRAVVTPDVKPSLQARRHGPRLMTSASVAASNDKFPPPHLDGSMGFKFGVSRENSVDRYSSSSLESWSFISNGLAYMNHLSRSVLRRKNQNKSEELVSSSSLKSNKPQDDRFMYMNQYSRSVSRGETHQSTKEQLSSSSLDSNKAPDEKFAYSRSVSQGQNSETFSSSSSQNVNGRFAYSRSISEGKNHNSKELESKQALDKRLGYANHYTRSISRGKSKGKQRLKIAPPAVLIGGFLPYTLSTKPEVRRKKSSPHLRDRRREQAAVASAT